ncbi:MAG: hypothetical protein ACYC0V_15715, partial [Armatimonadota bacterium]
MKITRILKLCVLFWFMASVFAGCQKDRMTFHDLTEPKFISETNDPKDFCIVAFDKMNRPHLRSGRDARPDQPLIITSDDNGARELASFNISRKDVDLVQRKLTEDMNNPLGAAYIKLLYDDPSGKKQIVRLHLWDDDYDFYYIYSVDGDVVRPLQYGDMTMRDGAMSSSAGMKSFTNLFFPGLA